MDTYVGAILGLPHTLNDEEIDQEYPTEVDDEYITEKRSGLCRGADFCDCWIQRSYENVQILAKIVLHIYPIKALNQQCRKFGHVQCSYAKIREIEKDLQDWLDQMPMD